MLPPVNLDQLTLGRIVKANCYDSYPENVNGTLTARKRPFSARLRTETARSYTYPRMLSRTPLSRGNMRVVGHLILTSVVTIEKIQTGPLPVRWLSGGRPYIRDKRIRLTLPQAIFLFAAGALGGALNAVAGGGSFIAFPALLFTGVGAVAANATNTLALWVGVTASGGAYRKHLNISKRVMVPLILTSIVGGLAGALLLIKTPAPNFLDVLPWLLLAATLLFAFGKHLTGRISAGISHESSNAAVVGASIFELVGAVYGGCL